MVVVLTLTGCKSASERLRLVEVDCKGKSMEEASAADARSCTSEMIALFRKASKDEKDFNRDAASREFPKALMTVCKKKDPAQCKLACQEYKSLVDEFPKDFKGLPADCEIALK